MAYNNYYPQFYPSAQPQFVPAQQQNNSGITWVQGENSAKSYPVGANQSVLLMDSESPVITSRAQTKAVCPCP